MLEWHETGCRYVSKHDKTGHMQAHHKQWMDQTVPELWINSPSEGSHSYLTPEDSHEYATSLGEAVGVW